jgi:hypothetical protein
MTTVLQPVGCYRVQLTYFAVMPARYFFSLFNLIVLSSSLVAQQQKNKPGTELGIRKATSPIVVDGKLDEPDWQTAQVAGNFYLNYPVDTAAAPFQTEARITYNDHALFVSFICYDDSKPNVVQSLRRDFDYSTNDNIGIYLGPYNDGINGFFFVVSPEGVQMEGTIAAAGADQNSYNSTWDNKWYSKVVRHEDKWIAEMMIPFKSFRYKSEAKEWNVTFLRNDLKHNHTSSWIATPIQFIPASFAYSGKLMWLDPPPKQSINISLIPFLAGSTATDRTVAPTTHSSDLQLGLDAKVAVTPSLNLDLTLNPDFSQVEVDRQVINLTRFEFQFPERRQFFLENNDLFERMGFPSARPFFSRRIGLAPDSNRTSPTLKRVPIQFGARLSGSINKKWRISFLNMQTKETLPVGLPTQNFTVAAIQRNFWRQSNIQFSFVNKESLGVTSFADSLKYFSSTLWKWRYNGDSTRTKVKNVYNRSATVDVEIRSADNMWYSSLYYGVSMDNFNLNQTQTGGGFAQFTKRNLQAFFGHTFNQKNYNAEAGYVPSQGVYPGVANTFASVYGTWYPKNSPIATMGPTLDVSMNNIPSGSIVDKTASLGYVINFLNTSNFNASYNYTFQQLTNSFNPIDEKKYTNYSSGESYVWHSYTANYISDQRKVFRYSLGTTIGGFYNGDNANVRGELSYRYQPYVSTSLRFDYNNIVLPNNYGVQEIWVVSPRFDLTFTRNLFFTTFIQYNSFRDNINLNARFQWRYKPASDFFIVYTENYLPSTLTGKNYSLVFKLTYWLNL